MEIICDMRDALLFYLFYIQNFFLKVHKKNYYFSPLRSAPGCIASSPTCQTVPPNRSLPLCKSKK